MTRDQFLITIDTDWAPDFTIDQAARVLIDHGVRATWFITHSSPAIERLRQHPELFELGIHPNFLPGSSHGQTVDAVLRHCFELVPDATSLRTHALVQSTPLLNQIVMETAVTTDVSLFLSHAPSLCPVEYRWAGRSLLRIPYFWEDDFEMERAEPCWSLGPLLESGPGLKVFDFHPIHIYLNSAEMAPYQALKRRAPRLSEAEVADAEICRQAGSGTQTMFTELVEHLAANRHSLQIRDIAERWGEDGGRA